MNSFARASFFVGILLASGGYSADASRSGVAALGLSLTPEQQKQAQEYVARKKVSSDISQKDTASIPDTTAQNLPEELSVYERLVRGEQLDPDSMRMSLKPFGYDAFRKAVGVSRDARGGMPADYPLSPGDELVITLWGRLNEETKCVIDREGNVNVPHVGPMPVAGQPFASVQTSIVGQLQNIEGVKASVAAGSMSDIRIFIMGEVASPGQYSVSALSGVVNALYAAGGITKSASLRTVSIRRGGKTIATVDLYDFLTAGGSFNDVRLKNNDVILVSPVKKMAAAVGNVRRSAFYELKGKALIKDLVELAGGLTAAAGSSIIQIDRYAGDSGRATIDVPMGSGGSLPAFEIRDGDIVKILPAPGIDMNAVFLTGHVLRPAKTAFQDGLKLSDVITSYRQLLPDAYMPYAVVKRPVPPTMANRILSFSLGEFLSGTPDADLALSAGDSIVIYPRSFFEPGINVQVGGSVTAPGLYPLQNDMRVKDLILLAGGFTENAGTERGELYRRQPFGDSIRTIKLDFNVNAAMQGDAPNNLLLEKGDQVFIRQRRGWEDRRTITIIGEVVFPGTYVVTEGEDFGNVIDRAGGFKSAAFLPAAIFTRKSVKAMEAKRNLEYSAKLESDIAALTQEVAASSASDNVEAAALLAQQKVMLDRLKATMPIGRVVVDFEDEILYRSMMIEDGDTLLVPKRISTVSVMGEVYNPATFLIRTTGNDARSYVEMAGGFKEGADQKSTYVIRASGSVVTRKMSRMGHYAMQPGDAVVVPQKVKVKNDRFKEVLSTINAVATLTANSLIIATNILLLRNATK